MNGKSILRRLLCIFCAAFFLAGMPLRAGAAEADPAQALTEESPETSADGEAAQTDSGDAGRGWGRGRGRTAGAGRLF